MSSLKNLLQGRPFGHPLHPLIIHLPLGMWLFALLLHIAGVAMADPWTLIPAATFHPMFPESTLPEGGTLRAECEGTVVTFARSSGKIFAVQEFCTHRCGPLSEGAVCDNQITCPWHGSRFDLATGKPTHG